MDANQKNPMLTQREKKKPQNRLNTRKKRVYQYTFAQVFQPELFRPYSITFFVYFVSFVVLLKMGFQFVLLTFKTFASCANYFEQEIAEETEIPSQGNNSMITTLSWNTNLR